LIVFHAHKLSVRQLKYINVRYYVAYTYVLLLSEMFMPRLPRVADGNEVRLVPNVT